MDKRLHFLGQEGFVESEAGQKAAQLHLLAVAGFPVPHGFAIPHGLSLEELGIEDLMSAIERIGGFPVAVRSSGNLEDLEGASFAGQYLSFLEVSSQQELVDRIFQCRQSALSSQVQVYLEKNGLAGKINRLAVLVQKMVPARVAGVGFSIHPITGREEHGLVECCEGLGEKLVSGHVAPSRYVLELRDGSTIEEELGSENVRLSSQHLRELSQRLLSIQAYFGRPQDIEWAIDGSDKLWMLQSRPVTQVQWRTDVDEFTNADLKDGGISARVCTPLMFSLYRQALSASMPEYFTRIRLLSRKAAFEQSWMESFYGRGYWNASATKRGLTLVPGFDEKSFDEDLGIQKSYGATGPLRVPVNLKTVLRAIPVAIALEKEYVGHLSRVESFGKTFDVEERSWKEKIARFAGTTDTEFFTDLRQVLLDFQLRTEVAYFTTIYNNSNAQSDLKSFVRKLDAKLEGETSLGRLLAGLTDVSHMNMQRGWVRLYHAAQTEGLRGPIFDAALTEFLRENDFHSDAELELKTPRWGEVPELVRERVANMLRTGIAPADPDASAQAQRREFESEVESVRQRIGKNWWNRFRFEKTFAKQLGRVRAYLSRREEMREYSTRCYYVVRLYVLEAGRRLSINWKLSSPEQVFLLHTHELVELGLVSRITDELRSSIQYRDLMYRGYRDFTPPNELGRGVSQRDEETFLEHYEDGRSVYKGLGCSPGQVEGIVRVIESMEQLDRIQKGDILVTRFTDPGWTPALGLVSGIVTEVGGMLSHAAVIGREYGIPAILNLPGATRRLESGQRVRIDGSRGLVEVVPHV